MKKFIYWTPRVLAITFITFIGLFAFDVFGENVSLVKKIQALVIHLIPTFIFITALVIAWKKEFWGGIIFIILGLLTILFFDTSKDIVVFFLITAPPVIIGLLFLIQACCKIKK